VTWLALTWGDFWDTNNPRQNPYDTFQRNGQEKSKESKTIFESKTTGRSIEKPGGILKIHIHLIKYYY
jgi:hypothetical protein